MARFYVPACPHSQPYICKLHRQLLKVQSSPSEGHGTSGRQVKLFWLYFLKPDVVLLSKAQSIRSSCHFLRQLFFLICLMSVDPIKTFHIFVLVVASRVKKNFRQVQACSNDPRVQFWWGKFIQHASLLFKDYRHTPLKVPDGEFNTDVRFLTLMHKGKTNCQKPSIKMEKLDNNPNLT